MTKDAPSFANFEDEARYWKKLALEYKASLEETREELDEFQSSSRELETELETQLEQVDAKCSDLRQQVNRLAFENQSLKERLSKEQNEYSSQLVLLQNELSDIKSNKVSLVKYVRELEQTNDDLERAKRTTVASLEDFESRLNVAIERNAFLESELDEKETLKEMVQRLKDEARDLRQEVHVRQKDHTNTIVPFTNGTCTEDKKISNTVIDSNKLAEKEHDDDLCQNNANIKCRSNINSINGNNTLPPSARVSALNIVGDLLRKVGALESRVASCRTTLAKENQRPISLPTNKGHSARHDEFLTLCSPVETDIIFS